MFCDSEHLLRGPLCDHISPKCTGLAKHPVILVDDPSPRKIAPYDPVAGGPNIIDDTAEGCT